MTEQHTTETPADGAAQQAEQAQQAATLVQADPATLIVGANVRLDPRIDRHFIGSIRERGVIEPIIAHTDTDGRLIVLAGQRRTLAAVQTGRATVPVVLVDSPDDIDRIIDQLAENQHRAAITPAEHLAAVEQLSLLGLSAAQVAKRTATPRATVTAALKVAHSDSAKAAHADGAMTLEQAAALVELEDDPEAVAAVLKAIEERRPVNFALQRAHEDRAKRRAIAEGVEQAIAEGLRILTDEAARNDAAKTLRALTDHDGNDIDPDAHRACLAQTWQRVFDHECDEHCEDNCRPGATSSSKSNSAPPNCGPNPTTPTAPTAATTTAATTTATARPERPRAHKGGPDLTVHRVKSGPPHRAGQAYPDTTAPAGTSRPPPPCQQHTHAVPPGKTLREHVGIRFEAR